MVLPLCEVGPRRVLNSLWRVLVILFQIIKIREGINQYMLGIMINAISAAVQFNERFMILDEGSKTEKRLVIIFSLLKLN